MQNQSLTEILSVTMELEASSTRMAAQWSNYQEMTRMLHRELQNVVELQQLRPGIFHQNTDMKRCAENFSLASELIAKETSQLKSVNLDDAEKNIQTVREIITRPNDSFDAQMVTEIDARLKSCEQNVQLARRYVNQLNVYLQYHARVLKTINLD